MGLSSAERLRRLGGGECIEPVCAAAGISRDEFDRWWSAAAKARAASPTGTRRAAVRSRVEIERDAWGIPHIFASTDDDLFFGFGYAMAQDRLFQLDYLRRKGYGRLAEILGPEALESDLVCRTVGLHRIPEREKAHLPSETLQLLEAFSGGVNAVIDESRGRLPIEFDLLGYEPGPWTPEDLLAIQADWGWYLTGRLPVIAIPELGKRALGDG